MLGNGAGSFSAGATPTAGNWPIAVIATDLDHDGHLDLVAANYDDPTISVFQGTGTGTFTNKATTTVHNGPDWVATGDFDEDGVPDVAVANANSNNMTVILGPLY